MTDDEIKKARELCAAATPGPWEERYVTLESGFHALGPPCYGSRGFTKQMPADAAFIAAARDLVPRLLDTVDGLRAERMTYESAMRDELEAEHGAYVAAMVEVDRCMQFEEDHLARQRLEAERDHLRDLLRRMRDKAAEAWPYAGEYFEEKHKDVELFYKVAAALGEKP